MYAVIKTGGKQHKVQAGDVIEVEKLVGPDETLTFTPLLVVDDDGEDPCGRGGLQGDRDREGRRRDEGRQGQGREVPAEDRVLAQERSSAAVHAARDLGEVSLG